MNLPQPVDFIDIHNHGGAPVAGQFSIENLMANEPKTPNHLPGIAYTIGIHPWYLTKETLTEQLIEGKHVCRSPGYYCAGGGWL